MRTVITNEKDATIIRQLASKEHRYAVNAVWAHPELRCELLTKVRGEIENECQSLCSNKNPSLFRRSSPQDLISFSENKCETELKEKAPVFHKCLQAATICRETRKKMDLGQKQCNTSSAITMAASVLLKRRCSQMCAQAYRFSIGVMWHSGAKKQVRKHVLSVFFFNHNPFTLALESFLTCFSTHQIKHN